MENYLKMISIMQDNNKKINIFVKITAVFLALLFWQAISMILNEVILMVSPIQVIKRLIEFMLEMNFWKSISWSLSRIAIGFILGLFSGILLGIFAGKFKPIEIMISPYIVSIKTVPVASFIIIALLWLNNSRLSILISFLMAFPIIYSNVLNGFKNTDEKLLSMAKSFKLSTYKKYIYIYLPQLKTYIISSAEASIGMAWKSGIAAEVIGLPDGSMGEKLYEAKIYLETSDLFAWTLAIVLVSLLSEKIFIFIIRLFYRWLERL